MTAEAEKLLQLILRLPNDDRAELAGRISDSVDIDTAWSDEIARRVADMRTGRSRPGSRWVDIRERALRQIDEARQS